MSRIPEWQYYKKNTYKTLNYDMLILPVSDYEYDRALVNYDFSRTEGITSVVNAVRLKLITMYSELYTNPTYQRWGNPAGFYLKSNRTELTLIELEEDMRKCFSEIRRVKYIDSLEIKEYQVSPTSFGIQINTFLTTISDETVNINELVKVYAI